MPTHEELHATFIRFKHQCLKGSGLELLLGAYRMARCFPLFWRWQIQIAEWPFGDPGVYWQTVRYNLSKENAEADLVRRQLEGEKVLW